MTCQTKKIAHVTNNKTILKSHYTSWITR